MNFSEEDKRNREKVTVSLPFFASYSSGCEEQGKEKCPSNVLLRHAVPTDAGGCQRFAKVDVTYSLRGILKNAGIQKNGVIGW